MKKISQLSEFAGNAEPRAPGREIREDTKDTYAFLSASRKDCSSVNTVTVAQ